MVERERILLNTQCYRRSFKEKWQGLRNTSGFGVFNCTFSDKFDCFIHILIIELSGESI